jgi:protein-arginine kinase activator protein McsA
MKVRDLLEELEEKQEYINFKEKNPETFFTAAFLILNTEQQTEEIQLDFFLPSENKICSSQIKPQINEGKIAAFCHPFTKPKIHDNIISVSKQGTTENAKVSEMSKQTTKIKIDIDDLEPRCKEIIKENDSALKPTKIIAILKDNIWNLTLMDNALGIIRIKINAISGETINFNKGSLMDFMGMKKK